MDDDFTENNDLTLLSDEELEKAILKTLQDNEDAPDDRENYPNSLYVLPLNRRPFFPGMAAPIVVEPGPYLDLVRLVAKTPHKCLGLLLTLDETADVNSLNIKDLYKVGVVAKILRIIPLETGGAQVVLNMEKRFKVKRISRTTVHMRCSVEYYEDPKLPSEELKAYAISIISTIKELLKLNPLFKEELQVFLGHSDFTDPGKLADFSVALTTASREELQDVLETFDLEARIDRALLLLKKELDLSHLLHSINEKIEGSISKSQREFFLREQLKAIKKELGLEKDEKVADIEKFEQRIEEREVPNDVLEVINDEIEKLQTLEAQSSEYGVCRGYLDWLTTIPWGLYSEDCADLDEASAILKKDHYGLEDTKERILEFIGVGMLSGRVKGSIICLVGPPGVGKTSIGKSIARALGRAFYRFSVGGMRDEAEIKGHRRTYVGAMPGKLVQALKHCQTMNPVIMLDEVDKMGSSFHGDPASALLEVLDPEQNKDFLDHYLDVRCDFSDILFIVTANVLDDIPAPLRDRMDIMRLSGYILEEKVEIAKRYLLPRHRKQMGLKAKNVTFTSKALTEIVNGYARESGVRTLEKLIKKILRKVAVKVVQNKSKKEPSYRITDKTLKQYLGNPVFSTDRFYNKTPVGVSMGLAWTAMGGATLYIEATQVPAMRSRMKLTGQAGDVMKESSEIAWSYLHSQLKRFAGDTPFFPRSEVHMHIPEGATPKDGPSAGITMVTALLSLLLDKPVLNNLAMTGELTLTGCVLAIGGVKEKIIAARRSKATVVIFPKDNKHDYDELPDYLKKGLEVHFVKTYDEVFSIAFAESPKRKKRR